MRGLTATLTFGRVESEQKKTRKLPIAIINQRKTADEEKLKISLCFLLSRPIRPTAKDITRLSNAGSNHDCGSLSRVVMVRKTDQRVINHKSQKVRMDF